jgi:hypothetical protein
VIADPVRKQIYLYTSSGTVSSTYGFTPSYDANGNFEAHASWSPDSQTVYIALGNQILVNSKFTGWHAISLTPTTTTAGTPATDVAVTVPSVGAYFAGPTTTARGYCPVTTLGTATTTNPVPATTNFFYPPADSSIAITDRIAATNDGMHILGASASAATLTDLGVNLAPTLLSSSNPNGTQSSASGGIVCPANGTALTFTSQAATVPLTGITPTTITGVLPTSVAATTTSAPLSAFVTYIGTGGVLPKYLPSAVQGGTGTATGSTTATPTVTAGKLTNIPLSGAATAPVSGVISTDNSTLYVGTSGDALVHIVSIPTSTDTKTIAPNLPCSPAVAMPGLTLPTNTPACVTFGAGTIAVPDLLVQKPRPST